MMWTVNIRIAILLPNSGFSSSFGLEPALVDLADADEEPSGQQRGVDDRDDVFPDHGFGFAVLGLVRCVRLNSRALRITTG